MSSSAITTIVKMVESLSDDLQERVAEHIREYIANLEDEARWESSFKNSQDKLVTAARQAKQEIAEGRSMPMDYEQLWSRLRCHRFGLSIDNWVILLEREREKLTSFGQKIRFIHLYILNVSIAKKDFGQFG